jgi:hypothetical protein
MAAMLMTCVMAVLCAYGAVMALWTFLGRPLGFPLVLEKPEWLKYIYRGVLDDGRDFGGCHTGGRLR